MVRGGKGEQLALCEAPIISERSPLGIPPNIDGSTIPMLDVEAAGPELRVSVIELGCRPGTVECATKAPNTKKRCGVRHKRRLCGELYMATARTWSGGEGYVKNV